MSKKYDYVLLTSVDIYLFPILSYGWKRKLSVIDHSVGKIASNKLYRRLWRICSSKVKLFVFEPFIKEMVDEMRIRKQTFVVRHPAYLSEKPRKSACFSSEKTVVFAPSSSNDESFICELMEYGIPRDIKVIIKSQCHQVKSESLLCYNGMLSEDDYCRYTEEASWILLPYGEDYNYRISGVLFDAAIMQKKILIDGKNTLREYQKIFPQQTSVFYSIDEMFSNMQDTNKNSNIDDYDLSAYCVTAISNELELAMKTT